MRRLTRMVMGVAIACAVGSAMTAARSTPATTPAQTQTPPPAKPAQTPAKTAAQTPAKPVAPKPAPLVNAPGQLWEEKVIAVPFAGKAVAYVPKKPTTHVVLFISGDGGWHLGVVDMARRIAPKAIVIGLDYVALRRSHMGSKNCWHLAGDLEEVAHAAERTLQLDEYHPPILIGYSSGATMVYGALAEGPSSTFAGGMSLGFCPDLPSDHPVCDGDNFKPKAYDAKKSTAWLPKVADIQKEWFVLLGVDDKVCNPPEMHVFLDDMKHAHLIDLPKTGHGFANEARWAPPFDESFTKLLAADTPEASRARPPSASAAEIEKQLDALGLPLEYVWSGQPRAQLIFLSGDGGWADLDQKVSAYLAAHGVSVVGISSVKYFWNARTPQQTAADARRVLDAIAASNVPAFIGGYSFGADVTPFVVQQWADADRRRIVGQVLVGASETASWQISVLDYVFRAKETPHNVADAVRSTRVPTLCLTGDKIAARDTACDDIASIASVVVLPGNHHFGGNYDAVGAAVMAFIDRQLKR